MANAWCINAYDCNGCLIQTLQNLDSACIGVGVQYTAPNPLDDKRLDYIKYTDKCWCVQCLSAENEILIYATNGVIKNLTLTNDDVNEAIKIKWNDIFWSNRAKTVVRYKTWSYPVSITDGTLAVEETTKNQYSSTPFSLSGVLDETTYYITAFAVDSNNVVIWTQQTTITTNFWWHPSANTLAYFPFESDWLDALWNYTLSNTWTQQTLWRRFTSQSLFTSTPTNVNTAVVRLKLNSIWTANYVQVMRCIARNLCFYVQWNPNNPCFWTYIQPNNYEWWSHLIWTWQRYLIWITRSKSWSTTTLKWYVNGVEYSIYSWWMPSDTPDNSWLIFTNQSVNMDLSRFIMENKTWSQSEIQDYFNKTRSKYGL